MREKERVQEGEEERALNKLKTKPNANKSPNAMMIYLRCIAAKKTTTTTAASKKFCIALYREIYLSKSFFVGDAGKTNKSEKRRKVLMEYCRKFCRKQHANKKETHTRRHTLTPRDTHTGRHRDTHSHMCSTNYESKQKAALKMQTQKFQRKRSKKKEEIYRKTEKEMLLFLLLLLLCWYRYFMLLLQFVNCWQRTAAQEGGEAGDTAAFVATPLLQRK